MNCVWVGHWWTFFATGNCVGRNEYGRYQKTVSLLHRDLVLFFCNSRNYLCCLFQFFKVYSIGSMASDFISLQTHVALIFWVAFREHLSKYCGCVSCSCVPFPMIIASNCFQISSVLVLFYVQSNSLKLFRRNRSERPHFFVVDFFYSACLASFQQDWNHIIFLKFNSGFLLSLCLRCSVNNSVDQLEFINFICCTLSRPCYTPISDVLDWIHVLLNFICNHPVLCFCFVRGNVHTVH